MGVSVSEYAAAAGISTRSARMRAEQGRIDAHRIGRMWIIRDHEVARARMEGKLPPGRPVSRAAFERLAALLDGDHQHLSPDQRRQARRLAARLRCDDNLRALRLIGRNRGGTPHAFHASPEDIDALRQEPDLEPAGITHPQQRNLSSSGLLEAYARPSQLPRLQALYGLTPVNGPGWNVMLRVIDEHPPQSRLRMAADLLDAGDPRSTTEASRVARELAQDAP